MNKFEVTVECFEYLSDQENEPTVSPQWRPLQCGETIHVGDECMDDECETWLPIAGWEVGVIYDPNFFVPIRRKNRET
jgi:hypothetical protein